VEPKHAHGKLVSELVHGLCNVELDGGRVILCTLSQRARRERLSFAQGDAVVIEVVGARGRVVGKVDPGERWRGLTAAQRAQARAAERNSKD
jgi:translation initiation factor IF-1